MHAGRNILLTFARQSAASLLRLAFTAIAARALGPAGNGQFALAMSVPNLLAGLLNLGVPAANAYFMAAGKLDTRTALRFNLQLFGSLSAAGLLGLALVLHFATSLLPGLSTHVLWLASLIFPIMLGAAFLASFLQARQDFIAFNRALLIPPALALPLLLTLYAAQTTHLSLLHVVLIQLAAELAGFAYAAAMIMRDLRVVDAQRSAASIRLRELLSFAGVMHIGNVLMQLSYRVDLFLVNALLGAKATGIYYIGVRVAEQVWAVSQPMTSVLLPTLASPERADAALRDTAPLALRFALYSAVLVGIALIVVVHPAVSWFFGSAYDDASGVVLLLLPGTLLLSGARIACVAMSARGKPHLNLWVNGTVFTLNVIANLFLIPRFGALGAAIARGGAYCVGSALAIWLLARMAGLSWLRILTPTREDLDLIRNFLPSVRRSP
jgi:O-antigen/teichoic acid export membrane protein